jgi:TctA family transporter
MNSVEIALIVVITLVGLVLLRWMLWLGLFLLAFVLQARAERRVRARLRAAGRR